MNKPTLFVAALAALASPLWGQNLPGTWQGTLEPAPGRTLRIVFKVSTTDGDSMKATMFSIDQPGPGLNAAAVTKQGTSVKLTFPGLGAGYEGKLSADGNSIAGTWSQGGGSLPLNMVRATDSTAWTIPEPPPPVAMMKADSNPGFEVATIKPSKPGQPGKGYTMRGKQVLTLNTSVDDLITFAYDLHPKQIVGAPAWMESERFDVTGEPDQPGRPNLRQMKVMIQKLLADRFKLTFHNEKKELSAYAIVLGKGGSKLTPSEGDPNGLPTLMFPKLGMLPGRNATMTDFAQVMQGAVLDRPVVDQTGLKGRFDFTLTWTPDPTQFVGMGVKVPPPADDPTAPPDLFAAFQQQLGLRLEAVKTPVSVLVVDKVEKPSEN
jgi:uncharacterized protein (TIGR03435 family)